MPLSPPPTESLPHCQVPLIASPPPPHGSPSSACQALQITTHANKSLETRTANVGLPWRLTPGAGSPGGRPVAQVCCGESWEGQNAWKRGDNVLCTVGVLSPGRAMGFATSSPSCPQGPSPAHVQLVRCDKCCPGFRKQVQPGPVGPAPSLHRPVSLPRGNGREKAHLGTSQGPSAS